MGAYGRQLLWVMVLWWSGWVMAATLPAEMPPLPYTLGPGAQGEIVTTLQQRLQAHGSTATFAPSVYDKTTTQAVKAFQKAQGIKADGKVGPKTWALLHVAPSLPQAGTEQPPSTGTPAEIVAPDPGTTSVATTQFTPTLPTTTETVPQTTPAVEPQTVPALPSEATAPPVTPNTTLPRQKIRIGAMGIRGKDEAVRKWGPTADYLTAHIPGFEFELVPFNFVEIRPAVAQGEVDFIITNPGMYVEMEAKYGVRHLATLKNLRLGEPYTVFGGVIFCRTDSTINTLKQMRGKKFAAVDAEAFGGWQMSWIEFVRQKVDPNDFASLEFLGTHDNVVYAVRDQKVDCGSVRTDTLERMEREGKINASLFKVINQNAAEENRFPFKLSTQLYPEWPFAMLPKTDPTLAEKVMVALLGIPRESKAAKAAQYAGWTVPLNYAPIHDTLRDLRAPPYEDYGKVTLVQVIQEYWPVILAVIALVLVSSFAAAYFQRLNLRLTHAQSRLQEELYEKMRAQRDLQDTWEQLRGKHTKLEQTLDKVQAMQKQIITQEKLASLGSLTAGIAHEIKNPLNFVNNFAELSKELVEELEEELEKHADKLDADTHGYIADTLGDLQQNLTKINEHGKRADSIVRNMLAHSRGKQGEKQLTDINAILDEYVNLAYHGMRAKDSGFNVGFDRQYDPAVGKLNVIPQDLSRVFLNILNNGFYAVNEKLKRKTTPDYAPKISIQTRKLPAGKIEIRLRDNGIGISQENIEKLFTPFFTTKPTGEGTGLGLSMSHEIVTQGHGGELLVESVVGEFAEFIVRLPG